MRKLLLALLPTLMALAIAVGLTAPAEGKPRPRPTPTPTPVSQYVQVCGLGLCKGGQPWGPLHAATTYGAYDTPAATVALAKDARLNAIELVNYAVIHHDLTSQTSAATFARLDGLIKAAKDGGIGIILNLSGYGHSLARQGVNITTHDWAPFLATMANHVNPHTGLAYKNDPTVYMVKIMGEFPKPGDPGSGTSAQILTFYDRTLDQVHAAFPNHIGTTGGFTHLNNPAYGIPWQQIMSLPENPICEFEIYSYDDRNITTPNVTQYCANLGKPWQLAAWSACDRPPNGDWDISGRPGDANMAAHFADMYAVAKGAAPAAYPALGRQFWNLRNGETGGCSVGSLTYPLTFAEVQRAAPS